MKRSNSAFDFVDLLYCECHKKSLDHNGSYKDSPHWIKNRKATIHPKYNYDK